MTCFGRTLIWQTNDEEVEEMYGTGISEELVRERHSRLLAEAEQRRLARMVAGPTLRARAARRLFGLAVALERNETWRIVWERLEAPKHP